MKIVSTLGLSTEEQEVIREKCKAVVEHRKNLAQLSEEELAETEVLLTYGNNMPEDIVSRMKSLRWIHCGQAGIDAMPLRLLHKMGVTVTNSRGINSVTIAEYVMCMLLNLERNTYRFYDSFVKREWNMQTRLDEVWGRKMAVFGLGKVGLELAKRAAAFDMEVIGVNPERVESPFITKQYQPSDILEVAALADYVVICMPLTEETRHMFGAEVFSHMKKTGVLVNVGRGAIVETEALKKALTQHQIRAAILDVLEEEPLAEDSALWKLDNIMITPHIAGDRQASYMPRMLRILCDNLNTYPRLEQLQNKVRLDLGF